MNTVQPPRWFRGLTARQREAFEALARGEQPRMHPGTVGALLRRGLVRRLVVPAPIGDNRITRSHYVVESGKLAEWEAYRARVAGEGDKE